jgi:hypothetical protein
LVIAALTLDATATTAEAISYHSGEEKDGMEKNADLVGS